MVTDVTFFLFPFFISFVIGFLLLYLMIMLNRRVSFIDPRKSVRHVHRKGISRFGGVAIITSFFLALLLDVRLIIDKPLVGIIIAAFFILAFGIIDDLRQVNWKIQMLFQLSIAIFVYLMGVKLNYFSNPLGGIINLENNFYWLSLLVSILWIVFLMNAVNWLDGIDGASGGIALIASLTIFFLSLKPEVNQPPVAIISIALAGGLVSFLLLNFYPAKIMAGTSGSMFMGFVLASLAIFAGAKIATTLLVLSIPIIDALWVIKERFKSGRSIFDADKRHLHFRLREFGWSERKICMFYYSITGVVALLSLQMRMVGKITIMMLIAAFLIFVSTLISKKLATKN